MSFYFQIHLHTKDVNNEPLCAVTTILYLLQYTDLSEAKKKLAMVFLKTEVEKLKNYDNATEAAMENNNC